MLAFLLSNAGYWAFALACIFVFVPFEKLFPRIQARAKAAGRLRTVAAIALLAVATSYFASAHLKADMISFFLQLKLFSIAKLQMPPTAVFIASFLFLDFLVFALHWLSHKVSFLWRIHAIHHSDEHVTALSGLLHHPLEMLISFTFVLFFAVVLGVPVLVLMIYPLIAAAHNAFSHADIALPRWIDRPLRWLIVTPDVHRTHHSVRMDEGNSNFGQIFTIWDRLFGTYCDRPSLPEASLVMGLPASEKPRSFNVQNLLALPFTRR